jgi:predicted DNA binding CopG/RHH family protein
VPHEIKELFFQKAEALGLSEAELLREMILIVVDQDNETDQPIAIKSEKTDLTRITVRIPRFMLEGAIERAKAKGMATSRWIAALVQGNLGYAPVLTNDELMALRRSISELSNVGRNINQIARAINSGHIKTEFFRHDTLTALSKAIDTTQAAIRALVRASQNVWTTDNLDNRTIPIPGGAESERKGGQNQKMWGDRVRSPYKQSAYITLF